MGGCPASNPRSAGWTIARGRNKGRTLPLRPWAREGGAAVAAFTEALKRRREQQEEERGRTRRRSQPVSEPTTIRTKDGGFVSLERGPEKEGPPFSAADLAAVLATCHRPRPRGRGLEGDAVATRRGRVDAVIVGLAFMAGMRRSEVSALRWADVADAADGDGLLVTVRRSKTNQEGDVNDVRFVKGGVARAIRTLRAATSPEPAERVVPLSPQMVGLRFTAAAAAAGVERRMTAHSGRVGLASELTSRGASTTDVMLAGNWKTSRMVAHYSAGGDRRARRRGALPLGGERVVCEMKLLTVPAVWIGGIVAAALAAWIKGFFKQFLPPPNECGWPSPTVFG